MNERISRARATARFGPAGASLGGLVALACTATEPTQIVGGVSTQIKVPDYLKSIGLVVQAQGQVIFCDSYPVTDGLTTLPASLAVSGSSGLGPNDTVTVQVLGLRTEQSSFDQDCVFSQSEPGLDNNREVLVIRRRRLTFVEGRILYLPLPLKESCRDQACGPEATCVGGRCVSSDVDANALPEFQGPLLFGTTNTCFNADICLPADATVPALLQDPNDCTFAIQWPADLPAPSPAGLNVRLLYDSLGTEVLDIDPSSAPDDQREGFFFPNPDDPLTFRLAPNLCSSNYQADRVMAVEASALCGAKRSYQPICNSYDPPDPRGGSGTAEAPPADGVGLCTLAALEPVESVVYVLMDRSQRMYPFYGDGGLRFAIELPLASPVARRTRIAFGPLPATAEQCGTDDYASPQVPFGSILDVRQPIANILSTLESVLPDNPMSVFLEGALQGAYAAVASTPVTALDQSAQRAVVVITNRDIAQGACMVGGPSALELAANAAAGATPIKTYAVALGDPNEDNPIADASTVASAAALAMAGNTDAFNGIADEVAGATSVLDILTELGTCSYRVNRLDLGLDGAGALPDSAVVSYVDPLAPMNSAVDIPLNRACVNGAPPEVSGWNRNGDRLEICGQACTDLRRVISNVTGVHLQQQLTAPPVPVVVSAPCDNFVLRTGP